MKTEELEQSESLNSEQEKQNNVELNSNNEVIEIPDTPFKGVKINDRWWIVLGNQAASGHTFESSVKLIHYVNQKPWELLLTAAQIIADNVVKNKIGVK